MRVYFLVEGRSTESKIYPAWLSHLLPSLKRIDYPDKPDENSYFLIDGAGYPSIIYTALPNAIKDINKYPTFNYLAICLDAEENTIQETISEINDFLAEENLVINGATLKIIVQNRCIETWLLGNRKFISANPTGATLREFMQFYNVRNENPELMPNYSNFNTTAQFHFHYLREAFKERNLSYSKHNLRESAEILKKTYLNQLQKRVKATPTHLLSLQTFFAFCEEIKNDII
jgi:hypothetical protein